MHAVLCARSLRRLHLILTSNVRDENDQLISFPFLITPTVAKTINTAYIHHIRPYMEDRDYSFGKKVDPASPQPASASSSPPVAPEEVQISLSLPVSGYLEVIQDSITHSATDLTDGLAGLTGKYKRALKYVLEKLPNRLFEWGCEFDWLPIWCLALNPDLLNAIAHMRPAWALVSSPSRTLTCFTFSSRVRSSWARCTRPCGMDGNVSLATGGTTVTSPTKQALSPCSSTTGVVPQVLRML